MSAAAQLSLRTLRTMHAVLLVSVLLYAFIGEHVEHQPLTENQRPLSAMTALAGLVVLLAAVLRKRMVAPSKEALRKEPNDLRALARWRFGTLFSLVLCEALAMIGFVVRFLGYPLQQAALFYVAAGVLMLVWWPRLDRSALGE